jgi:quercetin dioxygenase-like cupin family protein
VKYWTLTASCAAFALAAGCAKEPAAPGNITKNQIVSTETTMTGQPLRVPPLSVPQPPLQLIVTRVDAPAGALIACHKHPWSRYVYLESGAVRVTNYDANRTNDFTAGQELVEAIDQWHDARVTSPGPARLIVVDQVPPGTGNQIDAPSSGPSPCTTRR